MKNISNPMAINIMPPAIVALLANNVPNFLPIYTAAMQIPNVTRPTIANVK